MNVELRITTDDSLLPAELRSIQDGIRKGVSEYFANLETKSTGSVNKIVGAVLADPRVQDVRILGVRVGGTEVLDRDSGVIDIADIPKQLGELTITDPNLPTVLHASVVFPADAASPDQTRIEAALAEDIAYLNELNAAEIPADATAEERARRELTFGKLALAMPLPGSARVSLQDFDETAGTPAAPDLPVAADLGLYRIQWSFVTETGLSYLVGDETSPAYR